VLVETIEQLAPLHTLEEIAAVVRSAARRMTGADGVCFVIRQLDRCHYLDEDAIGPLWKGRTFPLTSCISGWAMLNRRTAVIPDVFVDPRIPHDAYRPTFVKSLVMTPVGGEEPIAAIGAYWAEVRAPLPEEIEALQTMARATATALSGAALYTSLNASLARSAFLNKELDHRVKNTLSTVQAIANMTLRKTPDPADFVRAFTGRLQSLSSAHELLTREAWKGVALRQAVREALAPYADPDGDGVAIDGPEMRLSAEAAVGVLGALHELATNAARYGAFSTPEGRVSVTWSIDPHSEPPVMELVWRERGGPEVVPPTARGFGLDVIEHSLPHRLGGAAEISFEPQGVVFRLRAPLSDRVGMA
jgi:two-component sensor histidine kinase